MNGGSRMNAIETKDLCKAYTGFKLDKINLELPEGCIMGLIGENGAGKSTLIKLILGMIKANSGTITLLGKENGGEITSLKEDIGVVLDDRGLPSCLNVKQIHKIMKNSFKNWNQPDFNDYIDRFGLPIDIKIKDFSTGMKMKLNIAIALSHNAKLLILDEATSGLDPVIRNEILNIFEEFTRNEHHTILISSHIVSDLEKICDYIAFLHKRKLMLCDDKDKLKEDYVLVHGTYDEIKALDPSSVVGTELNSYGAQAVVKKDVVPPNTKTTPVDIEQLFVFMVKEDA